MLTRAHSCSLTSLMLTELMPEVEYAHSTFLAAVSPYRHLQPAPPGEKLHGAYHTQRLRSSYTAFKIAVLSEIIQKQLFEEGQLRQLFRAYLTHNSLADLQIVRRVIADLQVEMNVSLA